MIEAKLFLQLLMRLLADPASLDGGCECLQPNTGTSFKQRSGASPARHQIGIHARDRRNPHFRPLIVAVARPCNGNFRRFAITNGRITLWAGIDADRQAPLQPGRPISQADAQAAGIARSTGRDRYT